MITFAISTTVTPEKVYSGVERLRKRRERGNPFRWIHVYPDSLPYFIHSLISYYLRKRVMAAFGIMLHFMCLPEGKDKMKLRVLVVKGYGSAAIIR